MKTRRFTLFIVTCSLFFALAFFGCKEEDPTTKLCTCNPKAHLGIGETCNCGGEDCTSCTLQVYGNVGGVNIYRKGAVTDFTTADDITDAVANVRAAYNADWPIGNKTILNKIIIITGSRPNKYEEDGKQTVELGDDMPINGMIMFLAGNTIS